MAGGITDIGQNEVLDLLFGSETPASWWLGLSLNEPIEFSSESNVIEVSGGGYSRIEVPNDEDHWLTAENGTKENRQAIAWSEATSSWGTVVSANLYDAASGGNLIAWARLGIGRNVFQGAKVFFAPRMLTFSILTSRR